MTTRTPISILFTIPNLDTAGSWGAMLRIIERLPPDEFRAAIGVRRLGGRGMEAAAEAGVPVHQITWPSVERPLRTLLQRCRSDASLVPERFDLWHSFDYAGNFAEPIVGRLAGARWIYTKKNMGWDRRALLRAHLAHGIVAQNTDMLERFFSSRRLRRRTSLIPRGVDTGRYRPGTSTGGFREHLGLGQGTMLLTSVAHLVPVKGHPELIRALGRIPDAHLALAGDGPAAYRFELEQLAAREGVSDRCHFLGAVTDVRGLLAETDLFVHTTIDEGKGEGSPVAVLEAMAIGLASVVTDVPGNRDMVRDRENGRLVPPADPSALSAAVNDLLTDADARRRLGDAARSSVLARWAIEREVAQHIELYRRVARGQSQ